MYDTIFVDNKEGQVKCWECVMADFQQGSVVDPIDDCETYSIAMREGGFVSIRELTVESWTDEPIYQPVFDKYGCPFNPKDQKELFNEPYFYADLEKSK